MPTCFVEGIAGDVEGYFEDLEGFFHTLEGFFGGVEGFWHMMFLARYTNNKNFFLNRKTRSVFLKNFRVFYFVYLILYVPIYCT